jgi:hypothetical protein
MPSGLLRTDFVQRHQVRDHEKDQRDRHAATCSAKNRFSVASAIT